MLTPTAAATHSDEAIPHVTDTARLLIVRHGPGRGPKITLRSLRPDRCQPMFDHITARWPEIGSRLDYWQTGTPQPSLENVAAVLFLLQDPLRETHPKCFEEAMLLASRAREQGARIVNDPACLSNTIKTTQSGLWREAGLPTPPCIAFKSIEELHAAAAEFDTPMLIKSDTQHAQKRTLVAQDLDHIKRVPSEDLPLPGSLSPFIETRSGYAEIDPESPYATHYHKKRVMVFGDHVRNNHVFFADQPIVGCVSSTFRHFRSMNPFKRAIGNAHCRSHVEWDIRYHNEVCEEPELFAKAAKVLGCEFCAIDYSTYADGRVVLWEANPYFSLHRWPIQILAGPRRLKERIPHLHETAAAFFRDLLSIAP